MSLPNQIHPFHVVGAGQYQIARSLRFRASNSGYLTRTPGGAGNRKTWTWSAWVKRGTLGSAQWLLDAYSDSQNFTAIFFNADNTLGAQHLVSNTSKVLKYTTAVYRDPSSAMHIVVAVDTSVASPTIKFYVNGTEVTSFGTNTNTLAQNDLTFVNNTVAHNLGRYGGNANYFDGLLSDVYLIDGQALAPTYFGQTDATTGVWVPKAYTGTYGTNGCHLDFADNSGATSTTIGKDTSGNGNNWTPNNISVTAGVTNDSLVDTPTNYGADTGAGGEVRGNYCTANPLAKASTIDLADGNLSSSGNNNGTWGAAGGTILVKDGKFYWEVYISSLTSNAEVMLGIHSGVDDWTQSSKYPGISATSYGYHSSTGNKYNNSSSSAFGATLAQGDYVGFALDMTAGTLAVYKNGSLQGTMASGLTGTWGPVFGLNKYYGASSISINCGQRPFAYAAPSGFKALCTQNLPTPTIIKPNQYFDAATYVGNGTTRTTTLEFPPDLLWGKDRTTGGAGYDHWLVDSVRGNDKTVSTNKAVDEESWGAGTVGISGNGLSTSTSAARFNGNGDNYITWNWKKGATPGFDIVAFTQSASAVNHSLGVKPAMIMAFERTGNNGAGGIVAHQSLGANMQDYVLNVTTTGAKTTSAGQWGGEPTSTQFYLASGMLGASVTAVAYLWAEVAGFSKFGTYTGNGSSNGPFVWCGFRPRFVLIKAASATGNWLLVDTATSPYNATPNVLLPNSSNAEVTTYGGQDNLSNGFKFRGAGSDYNGSTVTYIFAAFAERPFKYARAR